MTIIKLSVDQLLIVDQILVPQLVPICHRLLVLSLDYI